MISLAPAHSTAAEQAIRLPGGFAWWYLDLVDERGDGLVLIWSFGLPFLPGIRRVGGPPLDRPSLALSVYRGGKERFYLFQELPPEEVDWRPESGYGLFGKSLISLQRDPERVRLEIALNLEVPRGQPVQGTIRVEGPVRLGGDDPADEAPEHLWAPMLAAARGSARLFGSLPLELEGRAYLDHNVGQRPLHDLGIARWSWGRLALPGRELIWYHLQGERPGEERVRVLEIRADGGARRVDSPVRFGPSRWSWTGLRWPRTLEFQDPAGRTVSVRLRPPVDDAPFYQRFVVDGSCADEQGAGVAEQVAPGRLDRAWFRPLVRMRVHRVGRGNSMWLPLFTGPREGRLARLFRAPRALLPGRTDG